MILQRQAPRQIPLIPEQVDRKHPELILASGNLLPFHYLREGDRVGRAVVKIQRDDGATGTGFLVAPDILLTNHHVLPDVDTAAGAVALANYEASPLENAGERPAVAPLDPKALFVSNADLDFTFCGVRGLDNLGVIPIDRRQMDIRKNEVVNIIQHPRGRPKEIAIRDNRVVRSDKIVLQYSCDTEPGSSGSPVFNNQWKPVAVHHASVVSDGAGGDAATQSDPSVSFLNEGIRLSAIALWLETVEANGPARREQVARLRALFGGLNPKVGFFGALGRKGRGKPAHEVVIEAYKPCVENIDVGFWILKGLDSAEPERLDDAARVIVEMGLDLWCFSGVTSEVLNALRDRLRSIHGVDYDVSRPDVEDPSAPAILSRRSKSLEIETRFREKRATVSGVSSVELLFREGTSRRGVLKLSLVAVGRSPGDASRESAIHLAESFQSLLPDDPETDWLLLGDASAAWSAEASRFSTETGREIMSAADEFGTTAIRISGTLSRCDRTILSPNMRHVAGPPDSVAVANDREFPSDIQSLGGRPPIAVRLIFGDLKRRQTDKPPQFSQSSPAEEARPILPLDPGFEARLEELLGPIVARLVSEMVGKLKDKGGAK